MKAEATSDAAHERAVITVRLTLLLLVIGAALLLFPDPGGAPPSEHERGAHAERIR